jgi:UDPglucose 6-dehydrogenase
MQRKLSDQLSEKDERSAVGSHTEIPGANVDRITTALSHRMGKRFFKGAVPYGGPCWPRDNVALSVFMEAAGVPSLIPRTVDHFNAEHGKYVLRKVLEMTRYGESVGILGLAYKPGTPVIDSAFGVDLARWLAAEGRQVVVWDPQAMAEARAILGNTVCYATGGDGCIGLSQVVVIVNPLRELEQLSWAAVANRTVLDCWRCLSPEAISHLRHYHQLGVGQVADRRTLLDQVDFERFRLLTD